MDALYEAVAGALPHSIVYPQTVKTIKEKKTFKHKLLRENPETLMADYAQIGGKLSISNLLLYTTDCDAWHGAICTHYKYSKRHGICNGRQIQIKEEGDSNPCLTVNIYHNGTIMFQGSEACLISVRDNFNTIKLLAEEKKSETSHSKAAAKHSAHVNQGVEREMLALQSNDTLLEQTVKEIRESISIQEVELIELKEHITSQTSPCSMEQQLYDFRMEVMSYIEQLWGEMREMELERVSLKGHLKHLKEELYIRDEAIQDLKDQIIQMQNNKRQCNSSQPPVLNAAECSHPSSPATPQTCIRSSLESTTKAATRPTTQEKLHILPPEVPVSRMSATAETRLPSTQSHPQVILLTDSNGKFLDTKKLFPGKRVLSKRCSNTVQAMTLLKRETLHSPECLIIHTGTNDLHRLQNNTAAAMIRMAEQASTEFPESHIVLSTLLPRTDTPPHVIHNTNMEVASGCAKFPNIHLVHHPTIGPWDLYDGLHLHKKRVRIFAKSLKDASLRRNPGPFAIRPRQHASLPPHHPTGKKREANPTRPHFQRPSQLTSPPLTHLSQNKLSVPSATPPPQQPAPYVPQTPPPPYPMQKSNALAFTPHVSVHPPHHPPQQRIVVPTQCPKMSSSSWPLNPARPPSSTYPPPHPLQKMNRAATAQPPLAHQPKQSHATHTPFPPHPHRPSQNDAADPAHSFATRELEDIREMLHILCSQLIR